MDWDHTHKMAKVFIHGLPFAIINSFLFLRVPVFHYVPDLIPLPNVLANPPTLLLVLIFLILGTVSLNVPLSSTLWKVNLKSNITNDLVHGIILSTLLAFMHNVQFMFVSYLPLFSTILLIPLYAIPDGYIAREIVVLFASMQDSPFSTASGSSMEQGLEISGGTAKEKGMCPYCCHMNEFARTDLSVDGTAKCAMCRKSYFVLTKDVLLRQLGEDPTRIDL